MPIFCVYSCILYTKTAKCQFFNKVFGKYASFQSLPALLSDSIFHRFRKITSASVKSPFCGTFVLLYCKYTEGGQPPIHWKKRGTL